MTLSYSQAAMHALFVRERLHVTNAECWKRYPTVQELMKKTKEYEAEIKKLSDMCDLGTAAVGVDGICCAFDKEFPVLNYCSSEGDRPFVLLYKGDISLLEDLNKNIAVIGTLDPDSDTVERERSIVFELVNHEMNIVSGLANGCDSVAHQACMEAGGKTIAILPSQIDKLYPAKNRDLAKKIVDTGGLLLTEYAQGALSRTEALNRFPLRDRLQALFSKAVIMVASYRKGEGDSGSRHAMESAKKYQIRRYVMFDDRKDLEKPIFGLNCDMLKNEHDVKTICHSTIGKLALWEDPKLAGDMKTEQIRIDVD